MPTTKTVKAYLCHRCGRWWTPKGKPKRCGKCKSPYWDSPKKGKEVKEG